MSPHPSARSCILEATRVMHGPAVAAGLPPDALSCLTEVTLEGTQELMRSRDTGVILATGGIGLVRAAYSSGQARLRRGARATCPPTSSARPTCRRPCGT